MSDFSLTHEQERDVLNFDPWGERDAAHAALREMRDFSAAVFRVFAERVEATLEDIVAEAKLAGVADGFGVRAAAALAASAPQRETATWRCIFCGEPSETGGGYEAGEVGPFCESCYLHIEEHFGQAPAPAQETERGR